MSQYRRFCLGDQSAKSPSRSVAGGTLDFMPREGLEWVCATAVNAVGFPLSAVGEARRGAHPEAAHCGIHPRRGEA
jgi:hypothetical protein